MQDTLKTVIAGMGSSWLIWIELIPEIISTSVGIATFLYLCIKIYKELI